MFGNNKNHLQKETIHPTNRQIEPPSAHSEKIKRKRIVERGGETNEIRFRCARPPERILPLSRGRKTEIPTAQQAAGRAEFEFECRVRDGKGEDQRHGVSGHGLTVVEKRSRTYRYRMGEFWGGIEGDRFLFSAKVKTRSELKQPSLNKEDTGNILCLFAERG
ncbi:solute carrier family 15 member 1 [Anopheles sinensis]|uniref:Solute carrier family 15 member 1 n=1 Tax=Anopheles sinensis TaxID=74873 RepID=A0A084VJZ9_ANOSI|nr:solute carrier family 15 member 1 [Anopheles sinensis]